MALLINLVLFPAYHTREVRETAGFASYATVRGRPYAVGYDARALTVDGKRSLFVSGTLHYPRGAPEEWDGWLDEAVANGLNMIDIYLFWNLHAPAERGAGVWSGGADVIEFIRRCGERGLFVYLRVGPYVCAEWTYGGVPLWLAQKRGVSFRGTNPVWQQAMAAFFEEVVGRVAAARQFAPQGGPVALVQVENELQPTDRAYVEWCGRMAAAALRRVGAESVPLTMCNGETADDAIESCNGEDCAPFLEAGGATGRILRDQPGLWSENEGGFALWGGSAAGEPSYFWGRAPAELARNSLRWFARGGSLLNYYMFAGGSTRGLWAGAALTTAYATDVNLCHDGLRHGAKFHLLSAMHAALRAAAPDLVAAAPPANASGTPLEAARGARWTVDGAQLGFRYGDVAFVENGAPTAARVRLDALGCAGVEIELGASSTQLLRLGSSAPRQPVGLRTPSSSSVVELRNGGGAGAGCAASLLFRSDALPDGAPPPYHRALERLADAPPLRWQAWAEPLGEPTATEVGSLGASILARRPIEQGLVTRDRTAYASYTRHGTRFEGGCARGGGGAAANASCVLSVLVGKATALLVLVDGALVGRAHDKDHEAGTVVLNVSLRLDGLAAGRAHALTIVSEHLGYANYGFRTPLVKGLVGAVVLGGLDVTEGAWTIRAGLDGERLRLMGAHAAAAVRWREPAAAPRAVAPLSWYRAEFETPAEVFEAGLAGSARPQLHVNMTGFGRGHAWVNGHSLGRYWLLARETGPEAGVRPSQALYHVPTAWLASRPGARNVLTALEGPGGPSALDAALYVARMRPGPGTQYDARTWPSTITDCEM
jgi:hypothetical protein